MRRCLILTGIGEAWERPRLDRLKHRRGNETALRMAPAISMSNPLLGPLFDRQVLAKRSPSSASTAISKHDPEISAPHCARAGSEEIRRLRASVASSFAGYGSFR